MCTVCGCGGKAQVGLAYGGVRARRGAGAAAAPKPGDAPHQWRSLGDAVGRAPPPPAIITCTSAKARRAPTSPA